MNTPFFLLPSQIPHATRLADSLRAHGCALDASSPGAEKTYIACAVAASLDMRPMVITTKATIPAWVRTVRGFGLEPVGIVNYERIRMGKMEECMKIQRRLKGRSKSLFHWRLPKRTLLVFDEVQKCRAYRSVNAQLLLAAARQGIPRLLCSATAFVSPMDCFAIDAALKLYPDGWFWHWASEHGCRKGRFGWRFEGDEDDLRRIHRAIFPSKGSRLSLSDIPEFPETRIEALPIETGRGREIQAIYDRMKRELLAATQFQHAELPIGHHKEIAAPAGRVKETQAAQLLMEFLEARGFPGGFIRLYGCEFLLQSVHKKRVDELQNVALARVVRSQGAAFFRLHHALEHGTENGRGYFAPVQPAAIEQRLPHGRIEGGHGQELRKQAAVDVGEFQQDLVAPLHALFFRRIEHLKELRQQRRKVAPVFRRARGKVIMEGIAFKNARILGKQTEEQAHQIHLQRMAAVAGFLQGVMEFA